jgi:hypothetical protein
MPWLLTVVGLTMLGLTILARPENASDNFAFCILALDRLAAIGLGSETWGDHILVGDPVLYFSMARMEVSVSALWTKVLCQVLQAVCTEMRALRPAKGARM